MVPRPRMLFPVSLASMMMIAAASPALGAFNASDPNPLRSANVIRIQDVAAKGQTTAVGWRQGGAPGELHLAFSLDGGESFLRNNGKLRRYRIAGQGRLGLSLDVCGGKVWAASSAYFPGDTTGDTDVLVTNRVIGGGAGQAFMTNPTADRKVRDADIACVGGKLLAIAWLEQSGGRSKVKVMLRTPNLNSGAFRRVFGLGRANFRGGVAVAATGNMVHVAWSKGAKQNLRYKRFEIGGTKQRPSISRKRTVTVAFDKVRFPRIASIGQKVVVAYTDAGKVKAKLSLDSGDTFGGVLRLIGTGTQSKPSKVHSIGLVGERIVAEVTKRQKNGDMTPQRLQSQDLGATPFNVASFGHNGPRMGALQSLGGGDSLLREAWSNNGSPDTLRAQYETP